VCQLQTLRDCPARNVERVLKELPESLDETYLRVLKGIKGTNREDAYRLFQCLVVATRPLRVQELGEVLAVDFDSGEGIPMLNPDWRWEDQEEALQAACSSLIAIVEIDSDDSRVVQFSHFSVKEFLTSPRLADSSPDVSHYHISLEPAHKTLAQSCLGVLLRFPGDDQAYEDKADSEDEDKFIDDFPLAEYAARYWVDHAQFGNVSSGIWKGLQLLFDPTKLHFPAWLRFYDRDTQPGYHSFFYSFSYAYTRRHWASPLYYAALCGFRDLAEDLMVRHLQDVNARGGWYQIPLGAALAGKHFHVAQLLYDHGAKVDVRGSYEKTPLHALSTHGDPEIVQWLLRHGADTDIQTKNGWTPLHFAAVWGRFEAAQLLAKHNADVKIKNIDGETQLHVASRRGYPDVVRLLLVYGADMNARSNDGSTPLHQASQRRWTGGALEGKVAVACLLLEHGADIRAVDNSGRTAFHVADQDHEEMIKLLSEHVSK
jgi:Ankyrin repeats (3 copies)